MMVVWICRYYEFCVQLMARVVCSCTCFCNGYFLNEGKCTASSTAFATVVGALASRPKFVVGRLHIFIVGNNYVHFGRERCCRKEVFLVGSDWFWVRSD